MYTINQDGVKIYKKAKNEFLKCFFLEPIIYTIILFLVYNSIGTKSLIVFGLILCLLILYYFIFGVYAQLRFMKRINKTICQIDFVENIIMLKTDKLLWFNAKEYNVHKNNLQIKKRKFAWYNIKTDKDGLSIFVDNVELILVKDYFNDYESIIKQLH
jgi:hypothetical protein